MKNQRCMGRVMLLLVLATAVGSIALAKPELTIQREYEPIVINALSLKSLTDVPVDEIFMYAWDDDTQNWNLIPFQIDEQTYGPNPYQPASYRWFYFIPQVWSEVDTINITAHDNKFNGHDELVFMVRDLGDQPPDGAWIDNEESLIYPSIELVAEDPLNPESKAYGYIFRSSTISDAVPAPYDFGYNSTEDRISSKYYAIGMNENGTVDEIIIKEPGGSGQDILDLLKVRFSGVIDLAFPVPLVANEGILHLFEEKQATQQPVVRLIRYVNMTMQFGDFVAENVAFPVTALFYPFSGTMKGGTSLAPEDLIVYYNGEPIYIILNNIRESWDYHSNAVGMKFYNKYNNGILIDGNPDEVNKTVDIPVNNWDLTTGEQGSLWKFAQFTEQKWGGVEIYYHDNSNGGQADSDVFGDDDTGDGMSYGDNGILFRNKPDQDSITIDLNYTIYFLPEKNLDQSDGQRLADNVNNPVTTTHTSVSSSVEQSVYETPNEYHLEQNYPNPFNNSTIISFILPTTENVRLQIFDSNGRLVKILIEGQHESGLHKIAWNGFDDENHLVSSGLYFYTISTEKFTQTKKLVFIK